MTPTMRVPSSGCDNVVGGRRRRRHGVSSSAVTASFPTKAAFDMLYEQMVVLVSYRERDRQVARANLLGPLMNRTKRRARLAGCGAPALRTRPEFDDPAPTSGRADRCPSRLPAARRRQRASWNGAGVLDPIEAHVVTEQTHIVIATVLSTSIRIAIGSNAPARLGTPRSTSSRTPRLRRYRQPCTSKACAWNAARSRPLAELDAAGDSVDAVRHQPQDLATEVEPGSTPTTTPAQVLRAAPFGVRARDVSSEMSSGAG